MKRLVSEYADLMPLSEWRQAVKDGLFNECDGHGYWVQDGNYMNDHTFGGEDVFGAPPEGATHVAWFNK